MAQGLINEIKLAGFPIENSVIYFWSHIMQMYIHCGNEPLPYDTIIPKTEVRNGRLKLRCRMAVYNQFGTLLSIGSIQTLPTLSILQMQGESKKTKERKIGYIVEMLARWRKLYNGDYSYKNEPVRLTLDEAADYVGISKKSLDDYLMQIRFGRKFGFNFQNHSNNKVGLLRTYVKKMKRVQAYVDKNEMLQAKAMLAQKGTENCANLQCCKPLKSVFNISSD